MNMLEKVTDMIIAGGLSFTFLNHLYGMKIGKSLFDKDGNKIIDAIMIKVIKINNFINVLILQAKEKNVTIYFPLDFVCAEKKEENSKIKIIDVESGIDDNMAGYDIGPKSIELFEKVILSSKTVFWNGPLGVFEIENFKKGSISFVNTLIELTKQGGVTIVGGGETVNTVQLVISG